jgi:hypothetical protein
MQLFDEQGRRLYFTDEERRAFLRAAVTAPRETRSFCSTLHYTGCRISEALSVSPKRVDLSGKVIIFETLKKRRRGVFRACSCSGRSSFSVSWPPGARLNSPSVKNSGLSLLF